MHPSRHALLAVTLFAVLLPQVHAADRRKQPARPLLTRAEVKACIAREQELVRRSDALQGAYGEHDESGAHLAAEAMELSRILRTLDNTDAAAVEAFRSRNEARNQLVDAHNDRANALNAAQAELSQEQADYLAACASRPYLKADEDAALKSLGLTQRPRPRRPAPDNVPSVPMHRTPTAVGDA